jgi:biotin carboxylase
MTDSLIIIGASREQVRAYTVAKELGLYVIGTDMDANAPAFSFADLKLLASTRDIQETLASIQEIPSHLKVKGVMTIGNDAAKTVSAVAEYFKTPCISLKAAINASDKSLMKSCFRSAEVPTPEYKIVNSIKDLHEYCAQMSFPLVLKPSDGRGSRGVLFIDDATDLNDAYEYSIQNSVTKILLLEKFIDGDQLSVEGIFLNNKYMGVAFADRNYSRLSETKPFIIEDGGVIPSKHTGIILQDINLCIEKASRSLGISEGPVKADIVLNNGKPMIIELAARLSGNYLASHHLRWALGIDIVKAVIKYSIGNVIHEDDLLPTKKKYLAARYFFPEPGVIQSIEGVEEVESDSRVKKLEIYRKPGDVQQKIEANIHRAGIVRCLGDSLEEVTEIVETATKKIIFNVS